MGAVVDLVAGEFRVAAEVIPVRGVDDVFLPALRIGAGEESGDVFGADVARGVRNGERSLGFEGDGLEVARGGGGFECGKILAGGAEKLLRKIEREPRFHGDAGGVGVGRAQVEIFAAPAAGDDGEGITSGARLMDDEARGGALGGGDLVFVSPAPVVGHAFARENLRVELARRGVGDGRIVNEHDDSFAAHIEALVVVPAILRRDDAVAYENDFTGIDVNARRDAFGERDVVDEMRGFERLPARGEGGGGLRGDADHRHVLHVGAVGIAGGETDFFEFVDEVSDGFFFAR